jgi:hypothetical protein
VNRRYLGGGLFLFAGAVFLLIGLRSETRQPVWTILGPVFLVLGLVRLTRGRPR